MFPCVCVFETESHSIAQAGLRLMISSASFKSSTGITGVSCHAQVKFWLIESTVALTKIQFFFFFFNLSEEMHTYNPSFLGS